MLAFLMQIYKRNKTDRNFRHFAVSAMLEILEPQDVEFIPVITEILDSDEPPRDVALVIARKIPNPAFVPFIKTAIEKQKGINNGLPIDSLLEALSACGAEEEAVTEAVNILSKLPREDTSRNLFVDIYRNSETVLFLGKSQRENLVPLIEEFTRQEYIDKYKEVFAALDTNLMQDFCLDHLRQNAIMALARLGGKAAIPRLRQLYNSPDIRVRIVSAFGLYYNGDKTGEKLLLPLVKGTGRSIPEIEIRWYVDLAGQFRQLR